jgi:predicted hydrocarbon binding protein/predicted regulator of Ras-like GTPase activity (Roadblock/LC7/MglB family)
MSGKMVKMNKIAMNKLEEILNELNKTPGIIGSAIIKKDGNILVKQMPKYVDDEFVDILSAIHGCIEQVLSKSDEIAPKEVIIRGKYRNTIIINVGDAILMIISDLKANLNDILKISNDLAEDIKDFCNILFEDVLIPTNLIFSKIERGDLGRDVDVSIFRILRFMNLRKYTGVDSETLMYYFGKELSKNLKFSNFEELCKFYEKYKLGRIEMVSENPIKIRIYDCISCSGLPDVGKPLCHFEAGFLAGYIENIYNKEAEAIETHCWGLGDKFCQFEIRLVDK